MANPINLNTQRQPYTQPSYPQISTGPNNSNLPPLDNRVEAFNHNATVAFQSASALGEKVERFKAFINNVNNPAMPHSSDYLSLQTLVGSTTYRAICSTVSFAITKNANAEMGEKLLKENFLVILRIKDFEGRNPLDKALNQFISETETYRLIGETNYLAFTLELLHNSLEKTKRESLLTNPELFSTATTLKNDAVVKFQGLTKKAQDTLSEQLWKIDGEPPILNYGYDTALQDITKLFSHKGTSVIEKCLSELETKKNPSFTFSFHALNSEVILPSDSFETAENIQKIYYLEDLKILFSNPNLSNDFLASRFNKINPTLKDVKEMLCKIVAIASCEEQANIGFGENILNTNMRWLVRSQNKQGQTIIDQLIPHYTAKVELCRMEKEIENFILTNGKNIADRHNWFKAFNSLSLKVKESLRYKVWYYHGGKDNPKFTNDLCYGKNKIESDPYCLFHIYPNGETILKTYQLELIDKHKKCDGILLDELKRTRILPHDPIDVSTQSLEQEPGLIKQLPENLRLAVVTAEFEPAGLGGLRPAVSGMVRAFGAEDSRVVMPLYRNGPINDAIINSMKHTDHEIWVEDKRVPVMKANIDGVRCYFIDHDVFKIPKKDDGISAGNFYEGEYHYVRRRWAIFQKAAADLCYSFSKKRHPVELVHCHDGQTALVPKFLKEIHPEEWVKGETPVVHFTYHNNAEAMAFEDDECTLTLERMGLPRKPVNSFIEALEIADVKSTVSLQFGKESQMEHSDFGKGLHHFVKKAAYEESLFGVVNGNTMNWDPRKDGQLQKWTSVLPDTRGQKTDLRFGPNSSVQQLSQNTIRIQRELCAYLKGLHSKDPAYADLDPEKPIVMYLGRYDTRQKGINKLPLIMREAIDNGAQFVCIGLEPDSEAKHILWEMKEFAKERGHKGVLILEDYKVGSGLKYQGVFGSLLRAVCVPIFPSSFEPCGLVQGELMRFGREPIASATGGFKDTIQTEGPNANGYLFKRHNDWNSQEQDEEIRTTVRKALSNAKVVQHALYHGSITDITPHMEKAKLIMKNALNSTWEKTPDGSLSPIVKRQLIDARGFQKRKLRGGCSGFIDLKILTA